MNILSFDIGIKNLSYCLVCKDTKKINDWGIINISCDDECQHINTKNNKCDKKASFINDNDILLCSQHSKNKKYTKIKKYKNSSSLFDIGIKLLEKIKEKNFSEKNIEDVLLENQPVLKNPTMKSIQMILYSYFLNEVIDNKTIKKVEMINARNKLKAYEGEPINCDIKVANFGTFSNKVTPQRIGRNPKTGEEFIITERVKLNFIVSNKIKEQLN